MSKLAPRSMSGRPPQRLGALSTTDQNTNIDILSPEKWRHQTLIRSTGLILVYFFNVIY